MKSCYLDKTTRSIADLHPALDNGAWVITRINVPIEHRGKGHGSALLKRIVADADESGTVLQLEPVPTGGLNLTNLVAWYFRNGFTWKGCILERRPRTQRIPAEFYDEALGQGRR
jgi:N-acetylglutamate synthase-like GNAT family acetyltransferase